MKLLIKLILFLLILFIINCTTERVLHFVVIDKYFIEYSDVRVFDEDMPKNRAYFIVYKNLDTGLIEQLWVGVNDYYILNKNDSCKVTIKTY